MYRKNEDLFEHFLQGMDKELQAQLRYIFTHQMIQQEYQRKQEYERMKREIIEEVLNRIQVSVDISDVISKIKELRDEIDKLGK